MILDCNPGKYLKHKWTIIELVETENDKGEIIPPLSEDEFLNICDSLYALSGVKIDKIENTNLYIIHKMYGEDLWDKKLFEKAKEVNKSFKGVFNLSKQPEIFEDLPTDFYSKYRVKNKIIPLTLK